MSSSHCDEPVAVTRSIYISVAFCCVAIVVILPSAFKFFWHHSQHREQSERPPKVLYYTTVAFIIDTLLCLIFSIPTYLWKCNAQYNLLGTVLFTASYLGQYFLLLLIVFQRMFYAFRESVWQLKRCTIGVYAVAFIILAISLVVFSFLRPFAADSRDVIILNSIVSGQIAILSLTMCGLFIRKLYLVYNKGTVSDMRLIKTITKTSILTFICIISQFITTAVSSQVSSLSADTLFILYCFFGIDILTNYACIMLGHNFVDGHYRKVCGWLDDQCTSLILKCCGGAVIVAEFSAVHSTERSGHISGTAGLTVASSNSNRSSGNAVGPQTPDI